jgi:polysaccharide deacetylase family protein (PEP-CTERM system associated)
MPHALSIDLEDWHQLFRRKLTGELREPSESVVAATHELLDLLDQTGVRATFFVVGLLAEARPELVREVARRGHEIGSHSQNHELIYRMTPDTFRDEMRDARHRLEDIASVPVVGFRAPEFSVQSVDHWCFEALVQAGFRYDSSVFPVKARYGIPGAPTAPFSLSTKSGPLDEFPLASYQLLGRRLPVAGGTYWRFLPGALLARALADLEARDVPAVLYFHPYEFYRGLLYISGLGVCGTLQKAHMKYVVLHNLGTGLITRRLRPLLTRFEWKPICELQTPGVKSDNEEVGSWKERAKA